jgi:hypothetical protein
VSARRLIALFAMLPLSATVLVSWLCECLGAFSASERIDAWACPKIAALIMWCERGGV